jgi:phytoene dehydrogenase-like protein
LEWLTPNAFAAHPLDGGDAVILYNDIEQTAAALGVDQRRYLRSVGAIANDWPRLEPDILAPIGFPKHPLSFARFGLPALLPAQVYVRVAFSTVRARAAFAGCAAHSILPFSAAGSTAVGLALAAVGHARGWPVARGGSQSVADALAATLRAHGGEIVTGVNVERHEHLPKARVVLFDTSPRAMARIMGDRFRSGFSANLERYRYGPGAFKVDWALSAPIPWTARECHEATGIEVRSTIASARLHRGSECADAFGRDTSERCRRVARTAGRHTVWDIATCQWIDRGHDQRSKRRSSALRRASGIRSSPVPCARQPRSSARTRISSVAMWAADRTRCST